MARIVRIAFASMLFATPLPAQVANDRAPTPWQIPQEDAKQPSFDIIDYSPTTGGSNAKGSRIIAGTEVMANTSIGFGLFGEKAERPDHAPSINRDYSVPKSRKAAVGVALRF